MVKYSDFNILKTAKSDAVSYTNDQSLLYLLLTSCNWTKFTELQNVGTLTERVGYLDSTCRCAASFA